MFRLTSLGWSQILAKINEGDVCLLLLSIFVARENQCLQRSHLAKSLGQAANLEVQLTTTTQQQHNFVFYAASTCTWELCFGGGDLLKMQPGHSIGPRKLWNTSALMCVIHPYFLVSFTYNELLFKLHLFQDDGEPEAGQSVHGSWPLYCRIATVRHPGIQAGPVRSLTALPTCQAGKLCLVAPFVG